MEPDQVGRSDARALLEPSPVSRRGFVIAAAGAVGALGAGGLLSGCGRAERAALFATWEELLLALLPLTPEAVVGLAATAAAALGEGVTADGLVAGLPSNDSIGWTLEGGVSALAPERAMAACSSLIAAEYGEGRVEMVDRWILSRAEVHMLALMHMERGE